MIAVAHEVGLSILTAAILLAFVVSLAKILNCMDSPRRAVHEAALRDIACTPCETDDGRGAILCNAECGGCTARTSALTAIHYE